MTAVDRLGFHVRLTTADGMKGIRVPFKREVRSREEARTVLVEMVRRGARRRRLEQCIEVRVQELIVRAFFPKARHQLSRCPSSLLVRDWTPGPDRPRAHAGERGQRAREGAEDEFLGDQPSNASDQADSGCLYLLFIHPLAPNLISLRSAGRNRPCASSEARCSVRHGGQNAPVCDRMPAIGPALVFVQENEEQENA